MTRYATSSDPVLDAARYFDAVDADAEDAAREESIWRQLFIEDALRLNLADQNTLGEHTIDFSGPLVDGANRTRRRSTVAEVLYQSLDWPTGPSVDDLIFYVVSQAKSGEAGAMAVLNQMALAFARNR